MIRPLQHIRTNSKNRMAQSALVFGASGVSGWAFVNELLNGYPRPGLFQKIHALTNRPLSHATSQWPPSPLLNLVSGIDVLNGSQDEVEAALKRIEGIEEVTHVYYLAYKASLDWEKEYEDAEAMLRRSITAIDRLSPALKFVVLQTGSKTYGCHLLSQRSEINMPLPLHESHPRLPSPHAEKLFYNAQLDFLSSYAKDKPWNWCETRPDVIIGFVPNGGFYSLATSLGIFLALWTMIEGNGSTCPFPGSEGAWKALWNQGSSDMLARQAIHLSLTLPMSRKGEAFNVADEKEPENWEMKWPVLCSYFGLKGTPPLCEKERTEVRGYIEKHMDVWKEKEGKYELKRGIAKSLFCSKRFEFALLTLFGFDRQFDMGKMYGSGFGEERTTRESWGGVFDRMRSAKIIPS